MTKIVGNQHFKIFRLYVKKPSIGINDWFERVKSTEYRMIDDQSMKFKKQYGFGIKLYKKIDSIWPFKNNPGWLKKGREFFKTYGILGVFVGRFIGPVRPVMPITAGSMGMKFKHFLGVDLLSGLIWAPLYSLPGYFAGKIVFENTDSIYLFLGLAVILTLVILIFKKIFRDRT